MTSSAPLFSVVIPTRNRAQLLPFALRSALEQEHDDFEVVVVANNCQDDTRSVVEGMREPRLRYVETDRTLTMPDNWDFAWTTARGEYVVYLPDDDALVPSALRMLQEHTLHGRPPVVSWEDAPYYYPNWHDPQMQNLMLIFERGDHLVEDVPSTVYRDECTTFSFAWSSPFPKMLNCAAHRETLDAWRQKLGRLFFPIAPDYSFGWIVSHVFDYVRVLNRPLNVRGISDRSIGSNAGLGEATKEFFREFGDFDIFSEAPLELPVSMTYLASTFQRASAALREHGITPDRLDLERFLLVAAQQFRDGRELIANWETYVPGIVTLAGSMSPGTRTAVEEILAEPAAANPHGESIREIRRRTASMALEYPPNLANTAAEHLGDERCARCKLGLEPGVLASAGWECVYVFGEEIDAFDPHAMSRHVDAYYDLLTDCREKRQATQDD